MQKRLVTLLFLSFGAVFSKSEKEPLLFEDYRAHYSVFNYIPGLRHVLGSDKPKYYVGRLSEVEKPDRSLAHLWAYAKMKKDYFLGYSSLTSIVDEDGNQTFYICSKDESIFKFQRDAVKISYKAQMELQAQMIKDGAVLCFRSDDDVLDLVFVTAAYDDSLQKADSVCLVRTIKQLVKNRSFGVHVIDDTIVKLTGCLSGDTLSRDGILLTEDEIAQARSVINNDNQ